ncbi:MAG: InlB B-repeat-containing protein [Clostridia bacterium]|nr:InlB B-repeat-containing protein [Clostridia bacterium]
MEKIKEFLIICYNFIRGLYNQLKDALAKVDVFNKIYAYLDGIWPLHGKFRLDFAITIAVALFIVLIIVLICSIISYAKKRKVRFYVDGNLYAVTKTKLRKTIILPDDPEKEGFEFAGWYVDKKFKKQPKSKLRKKRLKLYAKFVEVNDEQVADVNNNAQEAEADVLVTSTPTTYSQVENKVVETEVNSADYTSKGYGQVKDDSEKEFKEANNSGVIEEVIDVNQIDSIGALYDDIRLEILSYERAASFKKIGVVRKHIIVEMFEKDEQIYLYLAASPQLMAQKGYNVETYTQQEFAIVPCKKVVTSVAEAEEAKRLIREVMTLNHFVKSEIVFAKKTVSDEQTRKKGLVFYVKNDIVVTTSTDYYKILRAIVLSYSASKSRKLSVDADNKRILKIFKKEEKLFMYLALDADKEGLEFVGYDKNFIDTPAMFEIKTAEDCLKANELIDKLMFVYGMDKNPEQAEISLDESVEANCGFGYRIRS